MKAKIAALLDAYKAADAAYNAAALAAYHAAYRAADDAWNEYQAALGEKGGKP